MGWRNLFSSCAVLCCVSYWFWREKGFGLNTHVLLRVQYSCGGVLVFWLQWEKVHGVLHILSIQYSNAVVSFFWMWREIVHFGCTYYYVLGVPYSCGVVLGFLVLAGNSCWCYVRT